MKTFFRSVALTGAFTLCLALLVSGCSNNQNQPKKKTPAVAPETVKLPATPTLPDDVFLTAVTGNILGTIDNATTVARQIDEGFQPDRFKMLLGEPFYDPDLKGFPKGNGMALVIPSSGDRFLILAVAPAMMSTYLQNLQKLGVPTAEVDGLILVASDPKSIEVGKELLKTDFKQRLRSKENSTVEITVNVQQILAKYKKQIDNWIETMAKASGAADGTAGTHKAQVIEAELRAMLLLGRQTRVLHTTLDFGNTGIRVDNVLAPIAGSDFAAFLDHPSPPFSDAPLRILPGKGSFRIAVTFDKKAFESFIEKEADLLSKEMKSGTKWIDTLVAIMKKSTAHWGNSYSVEMMLPGEPLLSGASVTQVDSPKATLAYLETAADMFKQKDVIDFYKTMGETLECSLTKDVRNHNGASIHQMKLEYSLNTLPPKIQEAIKKQLGPMTYQIASIGNMMITAMSGESIDDLIDAAKSGHPNPHFKPLDAQQTFGPGAQAYVDFAIGGIVHFIMGAMTSTLPPSNPNPFAGMETIFDGAPPITSAVYLRPDGLRVDFMIPAQLLSRTRGIFRKLRQENPGVEVPPQ